MKWHDHSRDVPEGSHAFLGASTYSRWLGKPIDEVIDKYRNFMIAQLRGTRLHSIAKDLISEGIRLPRTSATYNMYVNDAIGFRLDPEIALYYDHHSYGTTDAIDFNPKKGLLRIHDLKTGSTPASFKQLEIYAALFCLEYGPEMNFMPGDINYELRIYQNDEVLIENPDPKQIIDITHEIIEKSEALGEVDREERL